MLYKISKKEAGSWGDGSGYKSTGSAIMKTFVQISSIQIKSVSL